MARKVLSPCHDLDAVSEHLGSVEVTDETLSSVRAGRIRAASPEERVVRLSVRNRDEFGDLRSSLLSAGPSVCISYTPPEEAVAKAWRIVSASVTSLADNVLGIELRLKLAPGVTL